jgi:hypothetical protein
MRQFIAIMVLISIANICKSQIANYNDVIITEIFADPTPMVGLPNTEYIEIKNRSSQAFNLQGWRVGDASGSLGTINTSFILRPDSQVVLCTSSSVPLFAGIGTAIAVTSFPSLDNDGENLFLRSPQGKSIFSVTYTSQWHSNSIKRDGGWSLEMKNINHPCATTNNWGSSTQVTGGTPGQANSINTMASISEPLSLLNAFATDNTTILLSFNKPVDSLLSTVIANFTISNGLNIINAITLAPQLQVIQIKTNAPLVANTVYTVTVNNVKDCIGQNLAAPNTIQVGLTTTAAAGELLVNEILFNPRSNAFDFVEFVNPTNKLFNAKEIFIANKTGTTITNAKRLSETDRIVFPNEFYVATEAGLDLQNQYYVPKPNNIFELSSLPSFADDKGVCVFTNLSGTVLDELAYVDDWHFKLLDNEEGVSLERLLLTTATQNENNWHSAAVNKNDNKTGATPTGRNSQIFNGLISGDFSISPPSFSPDNDGQDDKCFINYSTTQAGYLGNITIFNSMGVPVRYLVRNALLSQTGFFVWDGLGEQGKALPMDKYVVVMEIFNLQGKRSTLKKVANLVRRL